MVLQVRRWLQNPWVPSVVLMVAGGLWLAELLCSIPGEVFFSGDAGLKSLMVEQLLRGDFAADLRLRGPSWVESLWAEGLYPFRSPFVHRIGDAWYTAFEWPFAALSVPGYALAGYAGLYVVPLGSLVALWVRFAFAAHRLGVDRWSTALAVGVLVFATPLSFYGACFWEHTASCFLAFTGYTALVLADDDPPPVSAGLSLGAAGWLRPEAFVFGAACLICVAAGRRGWRAPLGYGVGGAGYGAFNLALYGDVFGVHGLESLQGGTSLEQRLVDGVGRATALGDLWLESMPITWLVLVFVGLLLADRGQAGRTLRATVVVLVVTWAGTAVIAPNVGGLQIGPRYLLPMVAPLVLCVALGLTRLRMVRLLPRASMIAVVVTVGALSMRANLTDRTSFLQENYRGRIWPALASIQGYPGEAVIFAHPWAPMEMAHSFDGRVAVTVTNQDELNRALETIFAHKESALLVDGPGRRRFPVLGRGRHGSHEVVWSVLSEGAEYTVVRGRAVSN